MNINIRKRRQENEKGEIICIREINENLRRVFNNQPLTRPLRVLNQSCKFKEITQNHQKLCEQSVK